MQAQCKSARDDLAGRLSNRAYSPCISVSSVDVTIDYDLMSEITIYEHKIVFFFVIID